MAKYIAERESKRLIGIDIPQHIRYSAGEGDMTFVGVRVIDDQALALLKHDQPIMVLPIDKATAKRLSKLAVGSAVRVTLSGGITTAKGRGR